jgi:hypothetical protein
LVSSGLFPSGFPTKNLYTFLFSPMRATCPQHRLCQQARSWTPSVQAGPILNTVCASRPDPQHRLCKQATALTPSVLAGHSPVRAAQPGSDADHSPPSSAEVKNK